MSNAPRTASILNLPLIGPLLGQLRGENAPLAVIALALVLGIAAIAVFGYPALIVLVLIATFAMLGGLIVLTRAR
jgi:hypothetical protein